MKIKNLKLYTQNIKAEESFYGSKLGLPIVSQSYNSVTFKIGWSTLTFDLYDRSPLYHYCFLIPCNKLDQAFHWMKSKVDLLEIAPNQYTQEFEDWNATSFYFRDGSGNIAEFIVRYDLENKSSHDSFDQSEILGINEIGIPTSNIEKINTQLEQEIGTKWWKGNINRFGTNGDQEGLLLLPNYEVKKEWFPTEDTIIAESLEAVIEHNKKDFHIQYSKDKLIISSR